MIETLIKYLQYPFVIYAIIACILISIVSALIGTILIPKNLSFMGDGVSHVSFFTVIVVGILGMSTNEYIVTVPVAILVTLLLIKTKNISDAVLAVISSGTLGLGYLAINLFGKNTNVAGDVCGVLFGATNILTLELAEVIECAILVTAIIVFFVIKYRDIRTYVTDVAYFRVVNKYSKLIELIIASSIAAVIVFATSLVGALLATALIVFPVITASKLCESYKSFVIVSVILAAVASTIGLLISILYGTPVGATIIAINALLSTICLTFNKVGGHC